MSDCVIEKVCPAKDCSNPVEQTACKVGVCTPCHTAWFWHESEDPDEALREVLQGNVGQMPNVEGLASWESRRVEYGRSIRNLRLAFGLSMGDMSRFTGLTVSEISAAEVRGTEEEEAALTLLRDVARAGVIAEVYPRDEVSFLRKE